MSNGKPREHLVLLKCCRQLRFGQMPGSSQDWKGVLKQPTGEYHENCNNLPR